jgi:transcriptional regulator with XRE-family HTH domain
MGFKDNLRRLREAAGLTQTAMAEKAGVPFRSYQNWEAGVREPRIQALAALAAAVGVTVDELIREPPGADPGQPARKGAAGGGAPPKKPRDRKKGG